MLDTGPGPRHDVRGGTTGFVDATGPRMAFLSSGPGLFECWMWPVRVCHDLEVGLVAGDGIVAGREALVRTTTSPSELVLGYEHDAGTVEQRISCSRDRRVGVMTFEGSAPIEVSFTSDLRAMWPAAIGGVIAMVDEETGAFVLTEELGRFAVFLGSPGMTGASGADHGLPRDRVRLALEPGRPFVIAGAQVTPPPLSEEARRGLGSAATGASRLDGALSAARDLWREVADDPIAVRAEHREHWSRFLARTTRLETTLALGPAFTDALVAIEKAWVETDDLGRGLVAGLASSGGSDRPGFAWFFDGDAMIGGAALLAAGDFDGARSTLAFAASHQNDDGKLMHELTLSAGLCNWLEDYPYAYYKAENTAHFLYQLDRHLAQTGDVAFVASLADVIGRAHGWLVSVMSDEGFFEVRRAGLGAVEAGPLQDRIEAETWSQGLLMAGLRAVTRLAFVLKDHELAVAAQSDLERAEAAFESLWAEDENRYGFGRLVGGEPCVDLAAYTGLPLAFGFGRPERAAATATALNTPALAADWGARMFATDASTYDPEHYNCGSVFPFLNRYVIEALYRQGQVTAGWQLLDAQRALGVFSPGLIPEHLVGDRASEPERGVPHQVFSSSTIVLTAMSCLMGLEPAATDATLGFAPALPAGHDGIVRVTPYRLGATTLAVEAARSRSGGTTRLALRVVRIDGDDPLVLRMAPVLPAHSEVVAVRCGGRALTASMRERGETVECRLPPLTLEDALDVELELRCGPALALPDATIEPGTPSRALRVASGSIDEAGITWEVWGLAGKSYELEAITDRDVKWQGAEETGDDGRILVKIPEGTPGSFVRSEIRAGLA